MAKFKVLKPYKDLEIGRKLTPEKDKEVEMTVKRAKEVHEILKKKGFKGFFLERIDNKEEEQGEGK